MNAESIYAATGNRRIETFTGAMFDPLYPVFDIEDIATALSRIARFNGNTRTFYSVGQHSLMVSRLMEEVQECREDPLEGLLHDGTEAYLSDVPAPIKQLLPDWQVLDNRVEAALREYFGLPVKKSKACKKADWIALFIEAYWLMPSRGETYLDPMNMREVAARLIRNDPERWKIDNRHMDDVALAFRWRYDDLIQ